MAADGGTAQSQNRGKVDDAGKAINWGDASDTAIALALERLARSLRGWLDERLEIELTQERRTIDVRVQQEARVTVGELLKTNQQFLRQQEAAQELKEKGDARMRKWLKWWVIEAPKKAASSWLLLVVWTLVCAGWGWVGGINTPEWVVCSKQRSFCYQARFVGGNSGRQALDKLPKPQCVHTSRGLACLLEPVHKTQPKKQNQHH